MDGKAVTWVPVCMLLQNVAVLDPDLSKGYLDLIQNRTKERRYSFDHVFAPGCSNTVRKIYTPSIAY
jgi:hypothetical protein